MIDTKWNVDYQEYDEYYSNGNVWKKGFISRFPLAKVGKWIEWYKNGVKKREYYFNDSIPNLKEGKWLWWNEDEKLIKYEIYKNNELIEKKELMD